MELTEIEAELDRLTTAILPQLRSSKTLNEPAMTDLLALVDRLTAARTELELIPSRLAGKLLVVFAHILIQTDYMDDAEPVLRRAWNYEGQLEKFLLGRGLTTDVVTGEPIGSLHVHTDAVWVWYSDLPHYVERYDSPLPDALVSHAAAAAPPELSVEQLMEVAKVVRGTS